MMDCVAEWTTGSRWGYIHAADRGVESAPIPLPDTLHGLRGNKRWALEEFRRRGCTHYTVAWYQGVPGKGYSNQYCYAVYYGYRAAD